MGSFFEETGISVDSELSEQIWRLAGRALQAFAERRRKQRDKGARPILADFIIGAHAFTNEFRLLTLDGGLYRTALPSLAIETFEILSPSRLDPLLDSGNFRLHLTADRPSFIEPTL